MAVLLCLFMTGCGKEKTEDVTEETAPLTVTVANPERTSVSVDSRFSATVETNTVNVIPMVAGEVTSKFFEVGDHVDEGALLFTIDDETAKIAVSQANAALTTAKANYDTVLAQNAQAQAQSGVTFAGIIENEKSLEYKLDSAKAGSIESQYSANSAHRTLEYYEKQIDNINEDLSEANDALDKINGSINKAKKAGADTTPLETQKASIKSTINTLENSRDQMEMYRDTGRNSAGSADTAYMNTIEAVKLAELQLDNYKKYSEAAAMWGINASLVAADSSLKSADASVKQAQASVENAKIALNYTTVTAPVSGTITAINVSEHNLAPQGSPAYVIEDEAAKKVVFYVAEETAKNLSPGNAAVVSRKGEDFEAKISEVGTTVDNDTGLYKIKAECDADLATGTSVTLTTASRVDKSALTVPFNAVYYDGEQPFVYVAENGKAVRRDIESGLSDGELMAVMSGLTPTDSVIVSWGTGLRNGAAIEIADSQGTQKKTGTAGGTSAGTVTDTAKETASEAKETEGAAKKTTGTAKETTSETEETTGTAEPLG